MKQKFIIYSVSLAMFVILASAISYASHSPGAKTGSPADGNDCTKCHSGVAQSAHGWISSNIPASGYVSGNTYTITLTGTHQGVNKFGFEFTAEDSKSAKTGTFIITNTSETQLTNMMHAVTHTGNGLTPTNNQKTWSFKWTAPAAGTGNITFYASLVAANGNNSPAGDLVFDIDSTFIQDPSSSIQETEKNSRIIIYPNPVGNILSVKNMDQGNYQLQISDLSGKIVLEKSVQMNKESLSLDISNIPSGVYFLQLKQEKHLFIKRFIKN